jgi:SnoaL-like domain
MSKLQAIADRIEIEALRGEFTDASLMRDRHPVHTRRPVADAPHQRRVRQPGGGPRRGERLRGLWDYFVQTVHPARSSSRATSRSAAYVSEFGRFRHGTSNLNYSMYHDRYQRTPAGWKFTERVYEVRYLDVTPLAGSAPPQLRHER